MRRSFRETYNYTVSFSVYGIIFPIKLLIQATEKLKAFTINVRDYFYRFRITGAIAKFFVFQFMIDERIAAGKKKTAAGKDECISHNDKYFYQVGSLIIKTILITRVQSPSPLERGWGEVK